MPHVNDAFTRAYGRRQRISRAREENPVARTYDHLPEKRGEHRAKWHRSPHPMPETAVPLITEELAHMSAWRIYRRQREYGEANANAAMAAEYNRIIAHVGEPVDVLFGGA